MLGLKQIYPGRYEPAKLVNLIENEGATFSHCVPTILHMLLSAPEAENADLTGLKVIIGGSALPLGLAQAAVKKGIQVFTAYGMSETCPFVTVCDTMDIDHQDTTLDVLAVRRKTGKPGPLVDLRVVDEEMNDIPRGGNATGEVVIRTPWLTQGYTGNQDGSDELWRGGYLHTGDVGYLDETGSLIITDRLKDVIKSGGEWISSLELENLASACTGVEEVAAIGIKDEKWGERPVLIVKSENPDHESVTIEIQDAVSAQVKLGKLPRWAIPNTITYVDSIDKTSVGKLDKKKLREKFDS